MQLFGCSRGSPNSSNADVAEPQSVPQKVEIPGVGKVLKEFETNYALFDVDVMNTDNRHNEKNVETSCWTSGFAYWFSDEPFGRDTTKIVGKQVGENDYKLSITVDSESPTAMWAGDVTTDLKYDGATRSWSMSSVIFENGKEREYKYCSPSAVVDTLIANLQCYIGNNPNGAETETLQSLLKSLGEQKGKIVERSGQLYSSADCEPSVNPNDYKPDPSPPIAIP